MAVTTAPLSETAIATMAAGLLDEYTLVSLDDDTPLGRFLSREFGIVRDEVLQAYPWHPALKRAQLVPLVAAPAFGWAYAYQLPADCLRLLPLRRDGRLDGANIPYELEDGKVLCDQGTFLNVRYVQKLHNIALWRPLMARAFAAKLAMYAATRVTGKANYYQKSEAEFNRAMFDAAHADSLERGTTEPYSENVDVFTVRGYQGAY